MSPEHFLALLHFSHTFRTIHTIRSHISYNWYNVSYITFKLPPRITPQLLLNKVLFFTHKFSHVMHFKHCLPTASGPPIRTKSRRHRSMLPQKSHFWVCDAKSRPFASVPLWLIFYTPKNDGNIELRPIYAQQQHFSSIMILLCLKSSRIGYTKFLKCYGWRN